MVAAAVDRVAVAVAAEGWLADRVAPPGVPLMLITVAFGRRDVDAGSAIRPEVTVGRARPVPRRDNGASRRLLAGWAMSESNASTVGGNAIAGGRFGRHDFWERSVLSSRHDRHQMCEFILSEFCCLRAPSHPTGAGAQ